MLVFILLRSDAQTELLGIVSADFDIIDQLLIRYSAFVTYWSAVGQYQYISYL